MSILNQKFLTSALGGLALCSVANVGCAKAAPPATASSATASSATETAAAAWTPSAEEQAVYRALSLKDGGPSCEEVEALAADPVATLASVAEHAEMPPWVGMRAAHCLTTRHAEAAQDRFVAWVANPNLRGMALLLADDLTAMPEPVALRVATAGLAGPHSADLRKRLDRSEVPALKALVSP